MSKGRIVGIALAVVVTLVVIVVCWDWITGWWTPGWGNLFTVGAALLAVGVGAWINLLVLRRSIRNFEQARLDGRNDKLRSEVAALLGAATQWQAQKEIFDNRVLDLTTSWRESDQPPDNELALVAIKAAFNETMLSLYSGIEGNAFAIRMLTHDPVILQYVEETQELLRTQVSDAHSMWELARDPADAATIVPGIKQRQSELPSKIQSAIDELLSHCTGKFAVKD
jgi:hypothetical protein